MSVALQVAVLVGGIVAVLALIAVPIVLVYRRRYRVAGGWTHLVIRTATGEIGFFVKDLPAWMRDLTTAAGVAPDQP